MWKINYAQGVAFDEAISTMDEELERLAATLVELEVTLVRASELESTCSTHLRASTHYAPILIPTSGEPVA